MANGKNGVVVKWAAVILAAVLAAGTAIWGNARVSFKAEANTKAIEVTDKKVLAVDKKISALKDDVSEIKADIKVLLDRSKKD